MRLIVRFFSFYLLVTTVEDIEITAGTILEMRENFIFIVTIVRMVYYHHRITGELVMTQMFTHPRADRIKRSITCDRSIYVVVSLE